MAHDDAVHALLIARAVLDDAMIFEFGEDVLKNFDISDEVVGEFSEDVLAEFDIALAVLDEVIFEFGEVLMRTNCRAASVLESYLYLF
mmetsp:Transcript_42013/g.97955  ORF Transcript_42013/g.97955 Transcript_42013/m.97955 type:complete len:88 (+) Transcript_42013:140-403(+)|eukprot:CAMPEP_0114110772 /NCGR_PEP_ID=MMETSP0043_2-20121206/1486_1 /TAXON_ID=464988 /ORGANISM="Hemiselmis andersenii, Strain CCMP644" /LENGTH=87 /DNA_ID=CAMNT_0001202735 /DNA_START=130 /DNA_END=393 /DNA_ORIENTATION=+